MTNETTNNPTLLGQTFAPSAAPATVRQFGIVENTETLIIAVLVGVICCLLTLLIAVVMPYLFPVSDDMVPEDSESADPEKVKRRYQTIEDWLVTKEIRERERDENHVYQNVSSANTGSLARNDQKDSSEEEAKHNDEEAPSTADCEIHSGTSSCSAAKQHDGCHENHEEIEACQICMEDFKVGDSVSWSTGCDHVYHFSCIQEWLLKKTDCPYCRQTMLQVDGTDEYDVVALMSEKQKRANSTFFCLHEGLVVSESLATHSNKKVDLSDGRLDGLVIESPIIGNLRVAGENNEVAETVDMDLPNDDDSDRENGSHLVVVIEEDVEPAVISESSVQTFTVDEKTTGGTRCLESVEGNRT